MYAGGVEEAESGRSAVVSLVAWGVGATGRSMCWRAAAWYSVHVRGRWVVMFSVRMMWCHVGTSSCSGRRECVVWNWDRNAWSSWSVAGC